MQTTLGSVTGESPTLAFELRLRKHAQDYFRDLQGAPIQIRLLREQPRFASTLYSFALSSEQSRRFVIIKASSMQSVEREPRPKVNRAGRPRMAEKADLRTKQLLEYTTLRAIQDHFVTLGDPRFGFINTLDYWPDYSALVMEKMSRPNLRQLFSKKNRITQYFNSMSLEAAFRNAGAWLRHYQELPKQADVQVRHALREDFIETIAGYADYLQSMLGDEQFFENVKKRTSGLACRLLPDELPMGLGHGDYAMRNILVDSNHRITVLDTLGRWRVPIYEDVGYFLVRLKAAGPQIYSMNYLYDPSEIAKYEREFLLGYFDTEKIPFVAVRLFEIQALLDNWSSNVERLSEEGHTRGETLLLRARLMMVNHFFRRLISTLIDCNLS